MSREDLPPLAVHFVNAIHFVNSVHFIPGTGLAVLLLGCMGDALQLGCITVGMHLGCITFGMRLGCAYSWHDMCKGPASIPGMICARASRSIGQGIWSGITLRLSTLGHLMSGYRWANIPIYPF